MEILNKLHKNGSSKWISTWIFIYLSLFQFNSAVAQDIETTVFSSGMDDTTTYQETSPHITITPILSTVMSTSPASISTTLVTIESTTKLTPSCHSQTEFIPYGVNEGDEIFPPGDDNFVYKCSSIEVPIDSNELGCFFISTNGYITNGNLLPYSPATNEIDKSKITLMPLWTDIDTRNTGDFYYQIIDKYNRENRDINVINKNLQYAKDFFAKYGQNNFDPVWVLKLTWKSVVPFEGNPQTEKLTFQFILATDGTLTFMAYIYDDCEFSWSRLRNAIMGYSYPAYSYIHRDSLFPEIYDLGTKGNTQNMTSGVWIFELSSQYRTNYAQNCLDWSLQSRTPRPFIISRIDPCPCTRWQASEDFRFTLGPNDCYYLTFPIFGYSKACCYLNSGSFESNSLIRGNIQMHSAILNLVPWRIKDYQPYSDCCLNSDYCSLYNQFRPEDYCLNYMLPTIRFTFGDPHIQTLDGLSYTFNGLGEFEHLIVTNATKQDQVLMRIQCRTKEVGTGGRRATAFSGFAITSQGVTIQISTREQREEVKIFGDNLELTQFYTSNAVWRKGPFLLSAAPDKNDSYIIQHDSQTNMKISLEASILQFSITLGYDIKAVKTEGLLGTYNKNETDDLATPSGKILPANSTEEDIYYKFGLLWRVNQSIFHYESSESQASYLFPNFVPTFLKINKTSEEYKKAVEICTENEADCIYDYLITKQTNIAKSTKEIEKKIDQVKILSNASAPVLNGSTSLIVNVNQKTVQLINVIGNNLTMDVIQQKNCDLSLSNKQVRLEIDLNQVKPVVAAFQIRNAYDITTPFVNITVMVCPDCSNHGTCDTNAKSLLNNYEYTCKCNKGWRGQYCNIDSRCDPLNCSCSGPDNNYTCNCPSGYHFMDKCVDIDECLSNATNSCSQICRNIIGSYECSCNQGYVLVNKTKCINIDECALSLHNCDHICKDTDGSFSCSCYPGYKLNGTKCIKEIDICKGTNVCANASACTISNGSPKCLCKIGLEFNNITNLCEDIDECNNSPCNNGICVNGVGKYTCKCAIGNQLTNDRQTCKPCPHNKWGENCANTCSGANCLSCNKISGCVCEAGYKGVTCNEDINECLTNNPCNTTTSVCANTRGSYKCVCKDGFKLNSKKQCVDIDECFTASTCHLQADCSNTFGSYSCKCKTGYSGNGINCTDIDECSAVDHPCDHNCLNQMGSFSCTCRQNYKLQDDRVSCKKDSGLTYEERLYIIIFGSLAGAIIAGLLITLWCYCYGCCCCACCGRRRRRSRFLSTLEQDRYRLRDAFGSISSALRGGKAYNEPFAADSMNAAKYLEDWGNFSPYSENNRQEIGADNLGWEDLGDTSSSWGNIFNHFDNSAQFRIERPKIRN